jgi:hypothetical protein
MTVSMQNLVADPELAAIQRRREMLMGILRTNNQNQNYTSAVSPLGPVANALAAALLDYTGKREEDQLSTRRGEELQQFGRNVPSLGALLSPGAAPAASAIPNNPPPSPEVTPRAIPTSASLPAPTLPNGRPDFSRMADSAPAAPGQGFDPRQQHAQFAAMRREAMDTLTGPALDQRLAQISAQEAQTSSGLPTGPVYRRPEAERGSLWAAAAPAAPPSGAVPALGTPGGAPQAIPAQATPPQAPQATGTAPGASPQALEAAAAQRLQMAAEAAQSSNPRIREQATRLQAEAQFLLQAARREQPNPVMMSPGQTAIDPRTRQPIAHMPREPREWQEVYGEVQRLQQRVASGQATPDERRNLPRLEERLAGLTQPTGEGSFQRELGQRGATRVDAQLETATGARERMMTGQRVIQALNAGTITGTGAGARESLERALATAGLVDGSRVANTRQLMADLATGVLEASGSLRGPTSDRDIMFLREAAGGSIDLTPEAIRRIAQISMDRAQRDITRWNSTAQSIQGDQGIPAQIRHMYRPIEIPTVDAQPAGAPRPAAPAQAPAGVQAEPPGGGRQPVRVRTPEEARRLPSGTPIILPDGRQGVVP